ncbi:MAG: SpoIIE family protein phosphatase, partial [Oscillospiraceae bacterium]|nr:SpoIIE family protein phosphatase [Oscillospiraceae bacterium]
YRLSQMEKRYGSENGSMRELALEHLTETEDMLNYLGGGAETFLSCDENLSEHILSVLKQCGAKKPSAAALFDKEGRLYIECFYRGVLSERTDTLAERLCEISDRELDKPSSLTLDGVTHLRFHELPVYEAEIGKACVSGREYVSGDSDAVFRDGLGNLCILLSDGMGSGVRAAVESRMTVSVMTRLLRAGIGSSAAVRMLNGLLITKSPEEIFATIDLLKINLFTGKAELVKLGAAQTFLKTNGTVKTVESRTTPVGIVGSCEIDKRTAQLSDGDQIVMITDGICEECFPRVRELMLSIGVTAQDCAERIVAAAEKDKEENLSRQDDKTGYALYGQDADQHTKRERM